MNIAVKNKIGPISLFDIIRLLYSRKTKILFYTICLTAVTAIIVSFLPNIYISKAVIFPTEDTENIDYKFYAAWVAGSASANVTLHAMTPAPARGAVHARRPCTGHGTGGTRSVTRLGMRAAVAPVSSSPQPP